MSSRPKLIYEYFKQLFAQVSTHPGVASTALLLRSTTCLYCEDTP